LVVIAIIVILMALLLPALYRSRAKAHRVACLNQQRQFSLALQMYSLDNQDKLPSNGYADPKTGLKLWVAGDGHWNPPIFTNRDILINPSYSQFADYIRSPDIYRCPADRSNVDIDGQKIPKVRSYALNCYINWEWPPASNNSTNFQTFRKQSDFALASPAKTFTFADVAPGYVCHPAFVVVEGSGFYYHLPSAQHDRGSTVAFADGHADYQKWRDPKSVKDALTVQWIENHLYFTSRDNPDLKWLQERASVPIAPLGFN
jgi:prepilin-type processing-associated H-X9-DG protein